MSLPAFKPSTVVAILIQTLLLAPVTRADIIPATVDSNGVLTGNYGNTNDTYSYSGVDVTTIDGSASVVIASPGQYQNLNPTPHDALANSLVTNNGFFDIESTGAPIVLSQHLTNNGQLSVGAQLNLGDFTNQGDLEVWVSAAQLLVNGNFTNVNSSGLLSGGNYYIDSNSNLAYTGADIKTLDAGTYLTLANTQNGTPGQVLNLAGGSHDAVLNSLTDIYGNFSVQQNSVLTLNPAVTVHDGGTLQVDLNGKLTLAGGLTNLDSNGLLSGGNYEVGSDSKLIYTGADIQTLDANTSLTFTNNSGTNSGQILNLTGGSHNAVSNSLTTSNGAISVNNNAQLTLNQTFTNQTSGGIFLDTGGNITFHGGFGNVASGTLQTGYFVLGTGSSLTYTGADINTIASDANLVFDNSNGNATGQILNLTGGSHDAVSNSLTDNYGNIQVQNNAQLTLSKSFTNHDGSSLFVNAGGQVTLAGGFTNVSGTGRLGGGNYFIGANSSVTYTGADIQTVGSNTSVTFDQGSGDATGQILNTTGGSHDAITNSLTRNYGSIEIQNGAQLALNQSFTNHAIGTMDVNAGSQFSTSGSLNNNGAMSIEGSVSAQGMQQRGTLTIAAGGELSPGDDGTFTQTAGSTTVDGTLDPAAIDIFGGTFNGSGIVEGDVVNGGTDPSQAGDVAPGDGGNPGTLTVNGSYTQSSNGELDMVIDGQDQGTDYSFLNISGAASLGGYLNLTSFVDLTAGETFTILEANSINGTFSSSSFNSLDPSLSYSLIYQDQDVELSIGSADVATPEPGTFALFGGALAFVGLVFRRRVVRG